MSDVLDRIRVSIGAGDQKEFAEAAGISPQHLSDVLKGRRSPAGNILKHLGLEQVESLFKESEKGGFYGTRSK